MTPIKWTVFGVIVAAVLGALVVFSGGSSVDVAKLNENTVITEGPIADRTLGSKQNKLLLIEYGDFQCPGCGALHPRLKPLLEKYEQQITFVFRNLPLTSIHPNALAAASAAEAAGQQGKFFAMHDQLFETQDLWKNADAQERTRVFEGYARQLGLDVAKYNADIRSEAVSGKIARDQALAKKVKASSTPTLFLDGKLIGQEIFGDDAKLEEALKKAITSSGQKLPEQPAP